MDNSVNIGLDVHRDTISAAVLNREGQLIMQSVVPTPRAADSSTSSTGIRGTLQSPSRKNSFRVALRSAGNDEWLACLVCESAQNQPPEIGHKR